MYLCRFDDIMRAKGPDDGGETDSANYRYRTMQNETITSNNVVC